MSCEVHDYKYIRDHLDEYQYTMALVRKDIYENFPKEMMDKIPDDVRKKGIEISFYEYLLRSGEMSEPEHCMSCPFHGVIFNPIGQLCDQCNINTDIFIGDHFFASKEKRPEWCPLGKEK